MSYLVIAMLSFVMVSVVMLSVVMLSVVMLNVVVSYNHITLCVYSISFSVFDYIYLCLSISHFIAPKLLYFDRIKTFYNLIVSQLM